VDKLVILPSSVHETILVLPGIMMDKDELRNMVMEINDNVVRGGEILSDSVYIYTLENDEIHVLALATYELLEIFLKAEIID
jgi:hypothetical protein